MAAGPLGDRIRRRADGRAQRGSGPTSGAPALALAASKTITGPLSAFASAGYQYNGRGAAQVQDQFVSGLGLEYAITPHISVLAEGTANTNWRPDDDRHSDWIAGMNAGVRLRFGGFLDQPGRAQGLHQRRAGLGRLRPRHLRDERRDTVRREGGGRRRSRRGGGPGRARPAPAAPGAARRRGPLRARGPPGAGGPGAGGPGAAAPGAGAPGCGPGAAARVAPAPARRAGGRRAGAGAPGAGGPGAGGGPGAPGAVAGIPPAALPPSLRSALRDINFEFDQYSLTDDAKATLDELGQALKANPQFAVTIEGHADERGTVEYNLALAEQRAQAVKAYLVALGVDASRVDTISYGEQRPVDAGHDELAWAINRRAHFLVRGR